MNAANFNFWRDHSERYLKMAFQYDRRERIATPDGYGKRIGACGDTVEMFLAVRQGKIEHVSFDTNGCVNTNACGNSVAELAEGLTLEDAWEITPENVIDFLETLLPENYHCAELAVGALYLALADCKKRLKDS